jgi:hypothetical protein
MDHVIRLMLLVETGRDTRSDMVVADPNPLRDVAPGDTVSWVFDEQDAALGPSIVFKKRQTLPDDGAVPESCPPEGPFLGFERTARKITGTVAPDRQGRFLYDVFSGGVLHDWLNSMEGQNFGGIDLPKPPPDR